MSSTVIRRWGLTLHDVSTQISEKSISGLINNYLSGSHFKIGPGKSFHKNGKELRRFYINLDNKGSADTLMNNRSSLRLNGEQLRITRTLPKTLALYDRSVTGLKVKIHQSNNNNKSVDNKLNEFDSRKYFENFGKIRNCRLINEDQTEALFTFYDYDIVDQIMHWNPSPEIKGIKVDLEKTRTVQDYPTYERPYVIHVTNLPVRVTSEEIATFFNVPIGVILLYPCFRIEQSSIVGGRLSSEAWIKNFANERIARALAKEKTETFLRKNRIQCEVIPEPIYDEQELCVRFEKGQCPYTMETCYYKHFSCSEPDTCDDVNCWFGHTGKRTTVSVNRPQFRSEDAQYRVKFSNIPSNITRQDLISRLNIPSKFAQYLILQSAEENSNSPKMAYLIRQPLENHLRRQIDRWHDISFSLITSHKIQCQLEINQDYYEWYDSTDMLQTHDNSRCASPAPSIQSARSNKTTPAPWYPSAASTNGGRQTVSKKPHTPQQLQIIRQISINSSDGPTKKETTNSLKSRSISTMRRPPPDMSSLAPQCHWTNQMIPNDQFDSDEMYWIETESKKHKYVVAKLYLPKNNQTAELRAQHECLALKQLNKLVYVPKLLNSNVDTSNNDNQSNKELWAIITLFNSDRLSDYIKENKVDFRKALKITRRLLDMIKQIHIKDVIHRDIQPKNILIQQGTNTDEIIMALINFTSAWINNHSIEDFHDQLGNTFYRVPQFEQRSIETEPNETNQKLQQFRHSPTIDTSGIGAILFWMMTGHEPKESQDIWGQTPHNLRDHPKVIEKKINEVTGFRMEMTIPQHLQRHLMLIFDRSFAGPNQQWSVDELDYQLQFMTALIEGEGGESNYFPSLPPQNTMDNIPLPSIPLEDPFVYVVSLIHHLKYKFAARYSKCIRWSTGENKNWSSHDGRIEHNDLLIFSYQTKQLSVDINWNIIIKREQQFKVSINAKDHNKISIELPLGVWKINEQTNNFDIHLKYFEIEMKILLNILCKSIAS